MTNREYLNKLNNKEFSYAIYTVIVECVGMRYNSSIEGVAEWLDEEYNIRDFDILERFFNPRIYNTSY